MKPMRLSRVLALAGLAGVIGGVVLSELRGQKLEAAQARAEDQRARKAPNPRPKVYQLGGKTSFVDPEAVKYLPEYPKAVPTDLAELSQAQGVELKAGMFITPDPLQQVLDFYCDELEKAGWLTVTQHWGTGAAYVGFYGPDRRMHTVALMRSGSQTMVFLANSDPEAFLRAGARRLQDVPPVPDARGELAFTFSDQGMSRSTYYASTQSMTLVQAADFYRQQLPKLGWRLEESNDSQPGQVRLELKQPGKDLSLTLSKDEKENHVAVYAHLLARR